MYATVRRHEGVDKVRSAEISRKVGESLAHRLSELGRFGGDYLIDAGEGVFTSVSLFENAKEADESTRVAGRWVRDEKLELALPNTPEVTAGPVTAHESYGAAVAIGAAASA